MSQGKCSHCEALLLDYHKLVLCRISMAKPCNCTTGLLNLTPKPKPLLFLQDGA